MRHHGENQSYLIRNAWRPVAAGRDVGLRGFGRKLIGQLSHYVWVAILAWLSYGIINHCLLSTIRVTGFSMRPTLGDSDVFLLHRWTYLWRSPRPGDIVVIKDPTDNGYSIKRIIAGPRDFVCLRHGAVYKNGKMLAEPYLRPKTTTIIGGSSEAQWMTGCGAGEYVLLGDNRENSLDSRCYGPVSRQRILGVVFP